MLSIFQHQISKSTLFNTEISMLMGTLPKMNQLLESKLSGKGFYSQCGDSTFLVMEDLVPLGFKMSERQSGLDIEHILLAIRKLATFHASSVRLCEKVC